ncbi:hypothetical protein [Treponema zioleckii]|uniref:hypothetical protein n=1 Tax=Treponema zioleckii TaxID=331680 RepID=UPI00168A447E|nr:hypothetical protein [Treponema zioleckii]
MEKQGLITSKFEIKIFFQKVATDLLMVNIVNQAQSGIPSYWRLTKNVSIPPLELGVDCQNGFISNITFFVDGFDVKNIENINISISDGAVLVNTTVFKKTNDYIDVKQSYDVFYNKRKLICSFSEIKNFMKAFKMDRIEVFVNDKNQIVGFSICDLSENEEKLLRSIIQEKCYGSGGDILHIL